MKKKKFDFLKVCLCGKLCVNFHSVAMIDTLCIIRFLSKFNLPARASYKACLHCFTLKTLYFVNNIICTNDVSNHSCSYLYMRVRTGAYIYKPGMPQ